VITELCGIDIAERSTIAFGIVHILASITVTNRELRALALAEKDMTVDQYEKMMELQKIKTSDGEGNALNETKVC
jgi:hypothetical protein